tara:strand:- start:146 stop:403 length:258 start_codon:yes stop_codon:yes gene_type:complete
MVIKKKNQSKISILRFKRQKLKKLMIFLKIKKTRRNLCPRSKIKKILSLFRLRQKISPKKSRFLILKKQKSLLKRLKCPSTTKCK